LLNNGPFNEARHDRDKDYLYAAKTYTKAVEPNSN